MFGKKFSRAIAVLGFIIIIASLHMSSVSVQGAMPPPNAVWIDPGAISYSQYNATVGTLFNVTAWVNMNTTSFNWQVSLLFNATLLQATRAGYTGVSTSQFFAGHGTIPVTPVIDNTTITGGSVLIGESLLGTDTVGAGNGSLMWTEFKIIAAPNSTTTSLTGAFGINNTDTFVLDTNLAEIPIAKIGATYAFNYISDTTPPTIADPTQVPAKNNVNGSQAVTVSVNVTDNVGGSGVASVTLSYSTNNVTFTNATMTLNTLTGLYDGTIPGYPAGTTVYYLIYASDNAGNAATPNTNTGNWNYPVVPEFTSILMILMLVAMASAVLLMRKKIVR